MYPERLEHLVHPGHLEAFPLEVLYQLHPAVLYHPGFLLRPSYQEDRVHQRGLQ